MSGRSTCDPAVAVQLTLWLWSGAAGVEWDAVASDEPVTSHGRGDGGDGSSYSDVSRLPNWLAFAAQNPVGFLLGSPSKRW